jgi:hypothetical protein
MLRLAMGKPWRQTEGMLCSIIRMLGLDLPVPDHTTLSRRSARLPVTTALKNLKGPANVVIDPDSSEILAAELTTTHEGDASLVGPLLDQIDDPVSAVLRMERMMAILPIGPSSTVIRTPRWSSDPDQMRF